MIKSSKQFRLMEGIAHGMTPRGKGPSEAVAKEFISKTPRAKRKQFAQSINKHHSKN